MGQYEWMHKFEGSEEGGMIAYNLTIATVDEDLGILEVMGTDSTAESSEIPEFSRASGWRKLLRSRESC